MAFTQKDNTGAIFKNDKREKDSHPHAKGTALIDGVEYWISAWTKDGKHGKYQSLAFKRKDQQQAAARTADDPRTTMAQDDDAEIPF